MLSLLPAATSANLCVLLSTLTLVWHQLYNNTATLHWTAGSALPSYPSKQRPCSLVATGWEPYLSWLCVCVSYPSTAGRVDLKGVVMPQSDKCNTLLRRCSVVRASSVRSHLNEPISPRYLLIKPPRSKQKLWGCVNNVWSQKKQTEMRNTFSRASSVFLPAGYLKVVQKGSLLPQPQSVWVTTITSRAYPTNNVAGLPAVSVLLLDACLNLPPAQLFLEGNGRPPPFLVLIGSLALDDHQVS